MTGPDVDIAVIGGGPAGTHAAFKAALLHRTCVLFDKGRRFSRIYWSPRVDNLPGRYGESGRDIVAKGYSILEELAADYGTRFVTVHEDTEVQEVERVQDGFRIRAQGADGPVETVARVLVLATGAVDRQPRLQEFRRRDIEAVLPYANKGLADYCLLCDGHTVQGKKVAVLGCSPGVRGIAKSLKKNFGAETAIVPMCDPDAHKEAVQDPRDTWAHVEAELEAWGIPIHYGGVASFSGIKDGRFDITFEDGRTETFDKAWISMGWYKVNNEHAKALGAALDEDGFVKTDADGRVLDRDGKVLPRLYAIGDLRSGSWKQIPIAWGEAEAAVIDAFVHH